MLLINLSSLLSLNAGRTTITAVTTSPTRTHQNSIRERMNIRDIYSSRYLEEEESSEIDEHITINSKRETVESRVYEKCENHLTDEQYFRIIPGKDGPGDSKVSSEDKIIYYIL